MTVIAIPNAITASFISFSSELFVLVMFWGWRAADGNSEVCVCVCVHSHLGETPQGSVRH